MRSAALYDVPMHTNVEVGLKVNIREVWGGFENSPGFPGGINEFEPSGNL